MANSYTRNSDVDATPEQTLESLPRPADCQPTLQNVARLLTADSHTDLLLRFPYPHIVKHVVSHIFDLLQDVTRKLHIT
jgi:hypothetical protein